MINYIESSYLILIPTLALSSIWSFLAFPFDIQSDSMSSSKSAFIVPMVASLLLHPVFCLLSLSLSLTLLLSIFPLVSPRQSTLSVSLNWLHLFVCLPLSTSLSVVLFFPFLSFPFFSFLALSFFLPFFLSFGMRKIVFFVAFLRGRSVTEFDVFC